MSYEHLIGKTNTVKGNVTEDNTALALKSGSLKVLATPEMIRLIEQSAAELIDDNIAADETSVGISLNVKHTSPTPIGQSVRAEVKVIAVEGRKVSFEVVAFDECGEIGRGSHERFIVEREKFQRKADGKSI